MRDNAKPYPPNHYIIDDPPRLLPRFCPPTRLPKAPFFPCLGVSFRCGCAHCPATVVVTVGSVDAPPRSFSVARRASCVFAWTSALPRAAAWHTVVSSLEDGGAPSQAVVISGESGAGKTEASKLIMRYVFAAAAAAAAAVAAGGGGHAEEAAAAQHLTQRILDTNVVLEAFGNAKTVRNNNSSRFGKYTELHFDAHGCPVGARIRHYLLEQSRVARHAAGESGYHVFYQLLAGADAATRRALHLRPCETYRYLRGGDDERREAEVDDARVDDAAAFATTAAAMRTVGLTEDEIHSVWACLSVCLLLGDVAFSDAPDEGSVVAAAAGSREALAQAAALLGVSEVAMERTLTVRTLQCFARSGGGGGDTGATTQAFNSAAAAADCRDALAKALYCKLFDWLVARMNAAMRCCNAADAACPPQHTLGLLDIYGFEVFENNSLEQLCINYANEKLQAGFIQAVFVAEQEEYIREGLDWSCVGYKDTSACVELIERPSTGVLDLLNEQCLLNNGTDQR